ncbi:MULTISPECIES: hypothetical protein [Bacillus]|uniref:hypothetical protein n=1 Tax=Bacillus TaxID=1386 RepID=UPI001CFA3216|nr:hypothetical protein [Bacillus subtilis]MCB4341665.1 hypothetical protein [Bacillus subtilis]MCL9628284.1 hypothetical protein [Bacillus subtilis]
MYKIRGIMSNGTELRLTNDSEKEVEFTTTQEANDMIEQLKRSLSRDIEYHVDPIK